MRCGKLVGLVAALALSVLLSAQAASARDPGLEKVAAIHAMKGGSGGGSGGPVAKNFKVLGHNDLGLSESNGDVWVHGNFAYVGTWRDPCNGRGVKILDVSDLADPQLIGTAAAREGTSAEDMVVRRVSTPFFSGDLMGVGIQRCGEDPALDSQEFGLQLWNVTNPYAPVFLTEFGVGHGDGGVHELDLFQRGGKVYALLAHPFSEWFDPAGHGDFMIVDVTNPRFPVMTADWGAGENGFSRGPFWGQGSFGSMFGHSVRASADGKKAYVSYWDLGVLTFDISDVTNPVLTGRTTYEPWEDGDAHSMTPYKSKRGSFIFQNDEDFDPRTPAEISFKRGGGTHLRAPVEPRSGSRTSTGSRPRSSWRPTRGASRLTIPRAPPARSRSSTRRSLLRPAGDDRRPTLRHGGAGGGGRGRRGRRGRPRLRGREHVTAVVRLRQRRHPGAVR